MLHDGWHVSTYILHVYVETVGLMLQQLDATYRRSSKWKEHVLVIASWELNQHKGRPLADQPGVTPLAEFNT